LGVGDIHPKESLDYVISEFMAQARGEKIIAENLPVLRKDKSIFYADVSSTRILIDEKMCNVGFFSDSTERKKAGEILKRFNEELEQQIKSRTEDLAISLKEKETLLKEIHHRVRNNLQVVSSIISLQAKSVSDPGSLKQIQEIRMRIGTLALVHEIAYLAKTPESINMRDFLYRCTSKVIDEFGCEPGRINITITAENVQIALSQAVPCSLIVNELLMNSIRHAFPGKRHGEIKIGFSITKGNYVLEYGDDGVGLPEGIHPDKAETGGLALIQGLARQIRGTVGSTTRPGTGCTLTFPAETGGV
jgi:two-component sensor histidine kinase